MRSVSRNPLMKNALLLALAATAFGSFSAAYAADDWYGAAMGSAVIRDPNIPLDTGYGGHLVLGIPLTTNLNLEPNIYASHNEISNAGGSVTNIGAGADLNYFLLSGRVRPFVLGGLGAQRDGFKDLGARNEYSPFLDLGVGLTTPLTSSLGFRGEARAYAIRFKEFPGSNTAFDFRVNLGITFGGNNPAPPVAVRAAEPAPAPKVAPREEAPVAAEQPVPCAKPPKGQPVDDQGCLDLSKVQIKGVNFFVDSAELRKPAVVILDSVVSTLKAYPDMKVDIEGHTDSCGEARRNIDLSARRAKSVRDYLISKGINPDRLSTSSHGETEPVDSNDTRDGRANNRRVQFKIK